MSTTLVQVVVILFLVLLNGFFAFSELALVSVRKERLLANYDLEQRSVKTLLKLLETPNNFLSTVQIGITLIGVLSGALGGAALSNQLGQVLAQIPFIGNASAEIAFILIVGTITYLQIVLGELIPKRAAMSNPERFAVLVARPMAFLSRLFTPLERFLSFSVSVGMKLAGIQGTSSQPLSMDEIKLVIDKATEDGLVFETEQDLVEAVFRFSDLYLGAIVTPRTEIDWVDLESEPDEMLKSVRESKHAWLPAAKTNLDNVVGMLFVKDFYETFDPQKPEALLDVLKPALFLPENMLAIRALEQIKSAGVTVAVVMDEFGGLLGMVTLMDILETIVGEIQLTDEEDEISIFHRPDGSLLLDGLLHIDELKSILDLKELPEEQRVGYQTLGGFIINSLGHIPATGDSFEWEDFRFEIVDMDAHRIDKVLVTALSHDDNQPGETAWDI